MWLFDRLGQRLAHFLARPRDRYAFAPTCPPETLAATVRTGDVLLVEGTSRLSGAIKYITQSTWSHAALVVAGADGRAKPAPADCRLIEADVEAGVREVSLETYAHSHTRICRPIGLSAADVAQVVDHVEARRGYQYDLRNVIDLARYLIRNPPVPGRWRRRLLALGSGDPTKAICSSLIAQAFQSVRYPILPEIDRESATRPDCRGCYDELLHIRHHSLFAPRDFDISPFFEVIKPSLAHGFDPYALTWARPGVNFDAAARPEAAAQAPG